MIMIEIRCSTSNLQKGSVLNIRRRLVFKIQINAMFGSDKVSTLRPFILYNEEAPTKYVSNISEAV